jgi:translation initiation factor 3 subunit I
MPPLSLLQVEPEARVEFVAGSSGVSQAKLTLVNTSAFPVAFKVKTTASKSYTIKPGTGSIRRGGSADVILVQRLPEDGAAPPSEKGRKPDRFLVQAAAVETEPQQLLIHAANRGKAAGLAKFWDSLAKESVEEQQLEATFVDAPVAEGGHSASGTDTCKGAATNGLPSTEDVDAILGKISKPGRSVPMAKPTAAPPGASGPKLEHVGSPRGEDGGSVLKGQLLKKTAARKKEDVVINKHSRPVTAVTLDPVHNNVLFTCAKDKLILAWGIPEGEFIRSYEGHRGAVWSCSVSPDGLLLLSSGADNMVILWQVATATQLAEVQMPGVARCVEWQPEPPSSTSFLRWRFTVCSNSFSKRPAMLAVMEFEQADGQLKRTEPNTLMGPVEEPTLPSAASQVAWAGPSCEHICSVHTSGEVLFWSAASGNLVGRLQAHEGVTSQVAFSNGRDLMASCGREDCEVKLWDLRQGCASDQVAQLQHCKSDRPLNSVALRPSLAAAEVASRCAAAASSCGPRTAIVDVVIGGGQDARDVALVGAGADGQFDPVMLRLGVGSDLEEYEEDKGRGGGHFGPIHTLALWAKGALCVSGSEDGNVRLRDLREGASAPNSPRSHPPAPAPAAKLSAEPKAKAKTHVKSPALAPAVKSPAVPLPLADSLNRFVAIYDFDPAAAAWPTKSPHKPLALNRGQEVTLIQDVGQGWALGRCQGFPGQPERQGLYPTNYVMPYAKYAEMFAAAQAAQAQAYKTTVAQGADANQAFNLARQSLGKVPTSPQSPTKPQTLSLGMGLGLSQSAAPVNRYGHAEGELGLGDVVQAAVDAKAASGEADEEGDCAQS